MAPNLVDEEKLEAKAVIPIVILGMGFGAIMGYAVGKGKGAFIGSLIMGVASYSIIAMTRMV